MSTTEQAHTKSNGDARQDRSLTEYRLWLRAAGFSPIPDKGKKPLISNWETFEDVSEAVIASWPVEYPDHVNTGLLTKKTPFIDIDILSSPDAALAVERLVRERFKQGNILVRTGMAPKRAIPFRTSGPFPKYARKVIAPNGKEEGIEMLGDGQQVVVNGIHPDTGKPYHWRDGEPGEVKWSELPEITEAEAHTLVDDAVELLCTRFGFIPKPEPEASRSERDISGFGWPAFNSAALRDAHLWVQALFKGKARQSANGAWRVSSKDLGRDLEEDLSIHPTEGIKDFGIHDQGDPRHGKRSPIDLVMEYGNKDFNGAADWLSERLGRPRPDKAVERDDFVAYMPLHSYIFLGDREMWPATSVNARVGMITLCNYDGTPKLDAKGNPIVVPASKWLDQHRAIEQITWMPGLPMLINDKLVTMGGWIDRPGAVILNLYRSPTIKLGDPAQAQPWIDLVHKIYPNDAKHIINYYAHRVQRPGEKINHALVLGGAPGIGKDTTLEPVKLGIGPWNFQEVTPLQAMGRFNGFLKCVMMRMNEARDLGEVSRYTLYDHMKIFQAAPPDVLRVDEKNLREHVVPNVLGVVIGANKKDSLYLPADDRRHYVAWSQLTREDFTENFWTEFWGWYAAGGYGHVVAYLASVDLSGFDPKAPPPKTPAFWQIVTLNRSSEESEFSDLLDALGNPTAVTIEMLTEAAGDGYKIADLKVDLTKCRNAEFASWLRDRKNRRTIPHRMEAAGYSQLHNRDRKDALWLVGGKRVVIYARTELPPVEQYAAAAALVRAADQSRQ